MTTEAVRAAVERQRIGYASVTIGNETYSANHPVALAVCAVVRSRDEALQALAAAQAEASALREAKAKTERAAGEHIARLLKERDAAQDALKDMLGGWVYIRQQHGDLYGVGWDRCEQSARAALAQEAPTLQEAK